MTDLLFAILTAIIVYIYVGYPILLFLLAKAFPRFHLKDDSYEPSVTLIISARNEERVIGAKLQNVLEIDYPQEKLAVIVVSDNSTDRTDDIVRRFSNRGIVLVCTPERRGKTAGLNLAFSQVSSEFVIFSDANAMYDRYAIRKLVRHFVDRNVGYVVGYASYENTVETAAGQSEGAYWNIEVKMKGWESEFSSCVGGDGAIYAIRSHLYEPLLETDINDFVNPLQIVAKGFRGIFDADAWCSERPAGKFEKEFFRKVRITNRSFNGILRVPDACNPLIVGRFAWQLISHKLLRWFAPFFIGLHILILMLNTNVESLFMQVMLIMYILGATLALVGWWQDGNGKANVLCYLPYYFALVNIASGIGILLRLRGEVISVWETVRGEPSRKDHLTLLVPVLLCCIIIACFTRILIDYRFIHIL